MLAAGACGGDCGAGDPAASSHTAPAESTAPSSNISSSESNAAGGIRQEFEQICHRLRDGQTVLIGGAAVGYLTKRLETERDPRQQVAIRGRLAWESLRLDRAAEAERYIDEALQLAQQHELPDSIRWQLGYTSALVQLQLAEERNCVENHAAASCILPIQPSARHAHPEHIRRAGDTLQQLVAGQPPEALRANPLATQAVWLLNLSRMLSGDYPDGVPESLRAPPLAADDGVEFPRWRNIARSMGVDVVDLAGGAAMDDFDGDGLLDLITSTSDPCGSMKAFRNDGRGGFEDVTQAWGLQDQLGGLNLNHADYDNDGRLDLLVLRGAWLGADGQIRNSLLRNDLGGSGRFIDVTREAGLADPALPTQAGAWGDYDNDGDLDLYVANETRVPVPYTSLLFIEVLPIAKLLPAIEPGKEIDFSDIYRMFHDERIAYRSQLFRNNGDGTFTDVAEQAGVVNQRFGKGAAWGDYDNDGNLDLYVSNFGPNRLYHNNGDGTFTDVAARLGVVEPAIASFATWFFDHDNDGDLDLFVGDYSVPYPVVTGSYLGAQSTRGHSRLFRNDGDRFTDITERAGLARPLLPMGANHGDLDNDGWPDIYLGTGTPDLDALMPNVVLRNDGRGGYQDVTFASGLGHLQKGHGVAFGDFDNDGDQDMLEQMGGAYPSDAFGNALFENPAPSGSWITLRLEGTKSNRFAVGARIEVRVREGGEVRRIHALAGTGGSFGSSSLQQEIGLGHSQKIEAITIRWPGSGLVQTFEDVAPNRTYRITEGVEQAVLIDVPRPPKMVQTP